MARTKLTLYRSRLSSILKALRSEWDQGRKFHHAQATGLVLGQITRDLRRLPEYLDVTLDYVALRGVYGVDGILFTLMSGAEYTDAVRFSRAVGLCDTLSGSLDRGAKDGMGIFFADLGVGLRGHRLNTRAQNLLASDLSAASKGRSLAASSAGCSAQYWLTHLRVDRHRWNFRVARGVDLPGQAALEAGANRAPVRDPDQVRAPPAVRVAPEAARAADPGRAQAQVRAQDPEAAAVQARDQDRAPEQVPEQIPEQARDLAPVQAVAQVRGLVPAAVLAQARARTVTPIPSAPPRVNRRRSTRILMRRPRHNPAPIPPTRSPVPPCFAHSASAWAVRLIGDSRRGIRSDSRWNRS